MIGQRIRQLRTQKDMSLSELAECASVTKSYLSQLEREVHTNPGIQIIEKIANALGVTVDDILVEKVHITEGEMDKQWYNLMREVMDSGVTLAQFRDFVEYQKFQKSKKDNA